MKPDSCMSVERLGLHKTRLLHVGAAPVHRDVIEYFMKFSLPILELYGMSENTGPSTLNTIWNWKLGSVGKCMPGTQIKIDEPDENGDGEVKGLAIWSTAGSVLWYMV